MRLLAGQSLPLNANESCSHGSGSYKQDLFSPWSFPYEDWGDWLRLVCLPEESQGQSSADSSPKERIGLRMSSSVLHVNKQLPRSPRTVVAILEGAGLRHLLENIKCQAGVQTVFKCFKMQITTGFKFFPPLVKTKVKAGLPKSHRAAGLYFWGLAWAASVAKKG